MTEAREKAKFTPGPWKVRQSVYNGGAYDVHYAIETVDKQPEHPWSVRVVAWMTGGIRNDLSLAAIPSAKYCKECSRWHLYDREIGVDTRRDPKIEADAALIAAAPDLYEVLRAIKFLGWRPTPRHESKDVWCFPRYLVADLEAVLARAALSKTQGEEA